jgi:hypothetical protein
MITFASLLFHRLERVCKHIQKNIPVLSTAEKKMRQELETIQLQVNFLKDSLTQVRKTTYNNNIKIRPQRLYKVLFVKLVFLK